MTHLFLLVFVVCSAVAKLPDAFAEERPTVTLRGRVPRTAPPAADDASIVTGQGTLAAVASLSPDEIEQAMAFGRASKRLKAPALNASGTLLGRRTGHLFTAFWRVATMAQVAAARNQTLKAGDIPAVFVKKTAWVVATPTEHYVYSSDMDSPQYLASAGEIVIRPPHSRGPERDVRPLWKMYLGTRWDVDALASVLGRQFKRHSVVAAFPMEALQAGGTILVTYRKSAYTAEGFDGLSVGELTRRVNISERDLRKWR